MSQTMIRLAMKYFIYISSLNRDLDIYINDFPNFYNDLTAAFLIINIEIDFVLYPQLEHFLAISYFFDRFKKLDP